MFEKRKKYNRAEPVKLIAAITLSDIKLWADVKKALENGYSMIDSWLDWFDFHHSNYYREEMGEGLQKRMLSFQKFVFPEQLADIKLQAHDIEDRFIINGKRQANIDPGYLTLAKLVLATTKDYSHRIYLDKGILGDLHLKYQKGSFRPQEWTYPDYREAEVLQYFNRVRDIYLEQQRALAT